MATLLVQHVRYFLVKNGNLTKKLKPFECHVSCNRFLKTETELIEGASVDEQSERIEEDNNDWEQRLNKSRLLPQHRKMLFGEVPYDEPAAWYHETVKYKRAMYGKYGEKSGLNPGIMWPTREELAQIKEYEKKVFKRSVHELMAHNEKRKKEEADSIRDREEEISKKMAKLDQWKAELKAKITKKFADAQAAKERKDRLVEEVRRHFGFNVDPRDERFKEMLEQKEKEEKKSLKEAKKKAKEAKMLIKLQKASARLDEKNVSPEDTVK